MRVRLFHNFGLLYRAFVATRREASVSVMILLFVTLIFSIVLWIAEHAANPDYSLWDALVWVVVKYVEDPADVVVAPVTVLGQIIGTLVGILGIAIFAVPAGLIGSGLLDTMAEERLRRGLMIAASCYTSVFVVSRSQHRSLSTRWDIR